MFEETVVKHFSNFMKTINTLIQEVHQTPGRKSMQKCTQSNHKIKLLKISDRDGDGDGTPLQYSCLENPMDGGTW